MISWRDRCGHRAQRGHLLREHESLLRVLSLRDVVDDPEETGDAVDARDLFRADDDMNKTRGRAIVRGHASHGVKGFSMLERALQFGADNLSVRAIIGFHGALQLDVFSAQSEQLSRVI